MSRRFRSTPDARRLRSHAARVLRVSIAGGLLGAFAVSCGPASSGSGYASSGSGSGSGGPGSGSSGSAASRSGGASSGGTSGGASRGGTSGVMSGAGSGGSRDGGGSGSSSGEVTTGSSGGEAAGRGGSGGGGSSSGGGTGGATGDGSDGGAAAGCAGKSYKLCEDFESGTVGGIPTGWTILRGYSATRGNVGLANDEFHSGSMSLKSDSMETGMDRVQRSLATLGATATKHWGRIFYKVGSPPPTPKSGVIHITFAALEGTTENRVVDTVVATNGTHQWLFNIPDDSCCTGSSYDWSFDTSWHCAEWNIDVGAESFHFYSDGKEVTQLAFTGRAGAKMSNYMSIGLGTIFYQMPPSPVVVWFDDLAIDDNQIGCQ
jgi:hypothetical protein